MRLVVICRDMGMHRRRPCGGPRIPLEFRTMWFTGPWASEVHLLPQPSVFHPLLNSHPLSTAKDPRCGPHHPGHAAFLAQMHVCARKIRFSARSEFTALNRPTRACYQKRDTPSPQIGSEALGSVNHSKSSSSDRFEIISRWSLVVVLL
jgi:hypothetical protein